MQTGQSILGLVISVALGCQAPPPSLDELEGSRREKILKLKQSRPATSGKELEEWEQALLDAEQEHGVALLELAERRKDRYLYRKAADHLMEFIWQYDDYAKSYEAKFLLDRANKALREHRP